MPSIYSFLSSVMVLIFFRMKKDFGKSIENSFDSILNTLILLVCLFEIVWNS